MRNADFFLDVEKKIEIYWCVTQTSRTAFRKMKIGILVLVRKSTDTGTLRVSRYLSIFNIVIPEYAFTQCIDISCLNFWDEVWWFLSLRVLWLLSSSLLLFPQRFGRYVLRPSSGVCRTRESIRNFELRPLLNPEVACSDFVSHNWVQVLSIPVFLLARSQDWTCKLQMIVSLGNQRL